MAAAKSEERYMTVEEASEFLRMPVDTVRRKAAEGTLNAYKPGKRLLFDPADLRAFVKRFRVAK